MDELQTLRGKYAINFYVLLRNGKANNLRLPQKIVNYSA